MYLVHLEGFRHILVYGQLRCCRALSSQMSFDDEPVNCCVVFFFLRKGCRLAVIVVLLSILLTRLLYFSHAFDIML